jgi:hypothetical protein
MIWNSLRRVVDAVRQRIDCLFGHTDTLCFERERIYLRCGHCGRETVGWHVELKQPIRVLPFRRRA